MVHPTSIRLPDELREQIERLARAERRKPSNMIIVLIEEAIAARERRNKRRN